MARALLLLGILATRALGVGASCGDGPYADVHHAAMSGDVALVRRLIRAGTPVDLRTSDSAGMTCLMLSSRRGSKKMVRALLEEGARLDLSDQEEFMTAAEHAEDLGHKHVVEMLREWPEEKERYLAEQEAHRAAAVRSQQEAADERDERRLKKSQWEAEQFERVRAQMARRRRVQMVLITFACVFALLLAWWWRQRRATSSCGVVARAEAVAERRLQRVVGALEAKQLMKRRVQIVGLQSQPALNGRRGTVQCRHPTDGARVQVLLEGSDARLIAVKLDNLLMLRQLPLWVRLFLLLLSAMLLPAVPLTTWARIGYRSKELALALWSRSLEGGGYIPVGVGGGGGAGFANGFASLGGGAFPAIL